MSSPFGSATLVLQGPGGKLKYELSGDRTTVGRTKDNEVVLNDPAVSSHHCELVADKQGLSVRDLRSSNGTYVNGRRVTEGPVYDGDALKIGQYQGRINVFGVDGKPLRAPGARGPMVAIIAAVAVVLLAGVAFAFVTKRTRDADRKAFAEYETRVKEVLSLSTCAAAEANVPRLRAMESRLEKPVLGKRGKLAKPELAKDTEILAQSRKRTEFAEESQRNARMLLDKHKAAAAELKGLTKRFNDPELVAVGQAIEALLVDRASAGDEYVEAWGKYLDQLEEFHGHLAGLVQKQDAASAEALDGFTIRTDLGKTQEACESRFSKSHQDGLLKLATVAL